MSVLVFILIGAAAGLVMGMVGIGGGAIVIFSLLTVAHFPQKVAQGTTLLIVAAPLSLLAAFNYARHGLVEWQAGVIIMASFFVFSLAGSQLGIILPKHAMKSVMGVVLILMGVKALFF